MAWPYLNPLAREEMVAYQFLTGLDNHELRVQAATSDVRKMEDLMRIARSLEAVEGEETGRSCTRRGPTQARFTDETEESESEATRIADQIWALSCARVETQNADPLRLDPSECAVWNGRLHHQHSKMPRPRLSMKRARKRNGVVRLQL